MFCSNCGKTLDDGAVFCKFCGKKQDDEICAKCGNPLEPDAAFCANCGNPLSSGAARPAQAAPAWRPVQPPSYAPYMPPQAVTPRSRSGVLALGLALLLLLGSVGFGLARLDVIGGSEPLMPVDRDGNNLLGNIPENLANGGLFATQGDWYFFSDPDDGYTLHMYDTRNDVNIPVTEFPVANINVMGDTLAFTDMTGSVLETRTPSEGGAFTVSERLVGHDTFTPDELALGENEALRFGGDLYIVEGILRVMNDGEDVLALPVELFGGDAVYYNVTLSENGIRALATGELPEEEVAFEESIAQVSAARGGSALVEPLVMPLGTIKLASGMPTVAPMAVGGYVTVWDNGTLVSINEKTGEAVQLTYSGEGTVGGVTETEDHTIVATLTENAEGQTDHRITIFDKETGSIQTSLDGSGIGMQIVDGKIYYQGTDGYLHEYNIDNGQNTLVSESPLSSIADFEVLDDGEVVYRTGDPPQLIHAERGWWSGEWDHTSAGEDSDVMEDLLETKLGRGIDPKTQMAVEVEYGQMRLGKKGEDKSTWEVINLPPPDNSTNKNRYKLHAKNNGYDYKEDDTGETEATTASEESAGEIADLIDGLQNREEETEEPTEAETEESRGGSGASGNIVGAWIEDGGTEYYEFRDDGTYALGQAKGGSVQTNFSGKYELNGSELMINYNAYSDELLGPIYVEFDGERMAIDNQYERGKIWYVPYNG